MLSFWALPHVNEVNSNLFCIDSECIYFGPLSAGCRIFAKLCQSYSHDISWFFKSINQFTWNWAHFFIMLLYYFKLFITFLLC